MLGIQYFWKNVISMLQHSFWQNMVMKLQYDIFYLYALYGGKKKNR